MLRHSGCGFGRFRCYGSAAHLTWRQITRPTAPTVHGATTTARGVHNYGVFRPHTPSHAQTRFVHCLNQLRSFSTAAETHTPRQPSSGVSESNSHGSSAQQPVAAATTSTASSSSSSGSSSPQHPSGQAAADSPAEASNSAQPSSFQYGRIDIVMGPMFSGEFWVVRPVSFLCSLLSLPILIPRLRHDLALDIICFPSLVLTAECYKPRTLYNLPISVTHNCRLVIILMVKGITMLTRCGSACGSSCIIQKIVASVLLYHLA